MSCKCRDDIEKKLLDRFKEQQPDAKDHAVTLGGYTFTLEDGNAVMKGYMPYEFEALYPLKNGKTKRKTYKQAVVFSFCPFCGEKYPLKQKAEAAA